MSLREGEHFQGWEIQGSKPRDTHTNTVGLVSVPKDEKEKKLAFEIVYNYTVSNTMMHASAP